MTLPRRHHFVSQMILNRFTDDSGHLFVFDKRRRDSGIFYTKSVNAFVERDLNTVTLKDGRIDISLEQGYSKLESDVKPIIDKIISSARSRKIPSLTPIDRNTWDNFVYHQRKRPPDAFKRLGLVDKLPIDLEKFIAEYERAHRPLSKAERAELTSSEGIRRITQTASVKARSLGSEVVIAALATRGIAVALVVAPNKSFIIGDFPYARTKGHLESPTTEQWMPISADVAVSPWGAPMTEKLIGLDGDRVRRINMSIYEVSNIVASSSRALLLSLTRL